MLTICAGLSQRQAAVTAGVLSRLKTHDSQLHIGLLSRFATALPCEGEPGRAAGGVGPYRCRADGSLVGAGALDSPRGTTRSLRIRLGDVVKRVVSRRAAGGVGPYR